MTETTTTPAAAPGAGAPSPLTVHLEEFEGPLDLLLHLARTEEIDLARLPIRRITDQYLAYLESVEFRDLDDAGAFCIRAVTFKSRRAKVEFLTPRLLIPLHAIKAGERWTVQHGDYEIRSVDRCLFIVHHGDVIATAASLCVREVLEEMLGLEPGGLLEAH